MSDGNSVEYLCMMLLRWLRSDHASSSTRFWWRDEVAGRLTRSGGWSPLTAFGGRGEAALGSPAASSAQADPRPFGRDHGSGQRRRRRRDTGRVGIHSGMKKTSPFLCAQQETWDDQKDFSFYSPVIIISLKIIIEVKRGAATVRRERESACGGRI